MTTEQVIDIIARVAKCKPEDISPLIKRQIPVVLIARDIESANVDFVGK